MNINQKTNVLLTNLIVRQNNCDSFCKYCYHHRDENHTECSSPYTYQGKLKDDIEEILQFSATYFKSPIVKICGGEIFLMSNLKDFVSRLLEEYPYVLIQTNGKHLDDDNLKWIINSKRILMQISLDGHELEMNKYRFTEEETMKKMIHTIKILKENDVYLELTSVLNNSNTSRYDEFVEYLSQLPSGKIKNVLKVTPILLIDKEGVYKPSSEDISIIERLINNYEKFKNILPPEKYMTLLCKLLKGEKNVYQCYNPIVSVNFVDDGKMKACTNVLPEDVLNVGDIFTEDHKTIIEKFGKTKFQKLLLETKQWVPICKNCFNFCSIYNLFFNGTVSLEELCSNNYMFDLPEVRQVLIQINESRICSLT